MKTLKVKKYHDLRCVRCYAVLNYKHMVGQFCPACHAEILQRAKDNELFDSVDWSFVPVEEP